MLAAALLPLGLCLLPRPPLTHRPSFAHNVCGPARCHDPVLYFELDREFTEADVKTQYKRLAAKLHPDISKEEDALEKFQTRARHMFN